MLSTLKAREVLEAAFLARGLSPTLKELQAVQGIGRFEGNWGAAFGGANNWGAIQCPGKRPPCGQQCTEVTDTHAGGEPYQACVRRYASPVEGAADLVRELYRREGVPEALRAGIGRLIAERMRASGYFEAPVSKYASAIVAHAGKVADDLGEPRAVMLDGEILPVLPASKRGSVALLVALAVGGGFLLWRRAA
jgi:hypothetical protein